MSNFPKTQWSLIELAHQEVPTGSRRHVGKILEVYWQPMYSHLRFKGLKHEQAEDLVQEFTVELLNKDLISVADPNRGRFRNLLLTALDRFVVSKHRHDTAAKRAPEKMVSLDSLQTETSSGASKSPSTAFERAWALDVLAEAMSTMRQECEEAGEEIRWTIFELRVIAPLLDDAPVPDYNSLTQNLGLPNEKATMNLLVTAKRQFARTLRNQIQAYVTRNSDTDQQVKQLSLKLQDEHTSEKSAIRASRQLVDQLVTTRVEDEVEQLKAILSFANNTVPMTPDPSHESGQHKSYFFQRLISEGTVKPLEKLYDWNQGDESEVETDVMFQSILETPLKDVSTDLSGTIRSCLFDPNSTSQALEAIKDWASVQRANRSPTISREIASTIYYAAIASALVHCEQRITGLNDQALISGLQWVCDQEWVDEPVRELAQQACSNAAS